MLLGLKLVRNDSLYSYCVGFFKETSFSPNFSLSGQMMISALLSRSKLTCTDFHHSFYYRKSRNLERVSDALACCLEASPQLRYKI